MKKKMPEMKKMMAEKKKEMPAHGSKSEKKSPVKMGNVRANKTLRGYRK